MATWRELLNEAMREALDHRPITVAPSEDVLDVEFDDGFGTPKGPSVLVWTEARVYFPVAFDGVEWMDSAPRHPTREGQPHVGR